MASLSITTLLRMERKKPWRGHPGLLLLGVGPFGLVAAARTAGAFFLAELLGWLVVLKRRKKHFGLL